MNVEMAALWRKRLDEWSVSLLPTAKLCELHGVTLDQYYYWRKRLGHGSVLEKLNQDHDPAGERHGQWMGVEVVEPKPAPPTACGGVRVRLGDITIEVEPGFHPALLRAVLEALGVEQC